ncbi:serine/threonine-protein kinase [Streptomyces sp. KR80]|uniref:serine/threonine-protein kinase n=1 Tax=Streptomyces sp. KR80 TaxID=3457426 RepID=UPI003FD23868
MSEAEQTQGTTGRLLAGRYRLGEVLGRGGMGTVWRAVDETLGRTVAIKELRFSNVDEDEKQRLITRTLREAKAIARIRSSGAVTVYDVVNEGDRPWIVMELIEGSSLAEVVRDTGGLTPHRAAEVGLAVLDVLRAAHREGVLHRDVKPSNVLIADDGRVVLTDFGIAQVEGDPSLTSTGMLVGAPSYIAPERARGHKPGPPADLWSLGGLLYASVEGVPPYDKGSALATLTAVMTEPLDPPKNAGPLEEVIYGLLAKDPAQRLDDAGARALLTDALNAPEDQGPEAVERTRTMMLPQVPAAPEAEPTPEPKPEPMPGPGIGGSRPKPKLFPAPSAAVRARVEERLRSALQSVRTTAVQSVRDVAGAARAKMVATRNPDPRPDRPAPSTAAVSIMDVVPRRVLLVLAVVAALALLGTVLAFALGGDADRGGKPKGDKPASSAGTSGGAKSVESKAATEGTGQGAGKPSEAPKSPEEPEDDAEGDDDAEETTPEKGGRALPKGYAQKTDKLFHFTMALPEGWQRTRVAGRNSGGIYSRSGGFPRLQVDFTASPGDDALAAWKSLEPAVRDSSSGYRVLSIRKARYRGYPTVADWSFERNQGGQRVRVLNRGFRVDDDHGYSIMISCRKDAWDGKECKTLRDTAFKTFRPKD